MEEPSAHGLAPLVGLGLHLQIALTGQGFELVDVREQGVGEGEHEGRREVVAAAHLLRPPQRDPGAQPVGALERVHGPALVGLEPAEPPAHVVAQDRGRRGFGDQIDERGQALLDAHADGFSVGAVQEARVFGIGACDFHAYLFDQAR
ncbi:hypothetical protein GCM10020227_01290 [Streptomyces flavovirens]